MNIFKCLSAGLWILVTNGQKKAAEILILKGFPPF